MNRDELVASIVAARPGRDDTVYIERSGDAYNWRMAVAGDTQPTAAADVWMSFSSAWPLDEPARLRAFFDDLLAELESMADNAAGRASTRLPLSTVGCANSAHRVCPSPREQTQNRCWRESSVGHPRPR